MLDSGGSRYELALSVAERKVDFRKVDFRKVFRSCAISWDEESPYDSCVRLANRLHLLNSPDVQQKQEAWFLKKCVRHWDFKRRHL
jgi:hypothetical protein